MVEIRLYEKNSSYRGDNETVTVKTEPFNENKSYEKSVYEIDYFYTYETWFWWIYKSYLNVYIYFKEGEKPIFTYNVSTTGHIIRQVEVYYSTSNKNVPLVVGLRRKDGIRYFEYLHLKNTGSHLGVPDQEFFDDTLVKRLDQENNKRNSLTFRVTGSSRNLKQENEAYHNFVKHKYSIDQDNSDGPYEFCTDKLTGQGISTDVSHSTFKSMDGMHFEFINLIYTEQGDMALLVEFIEPKRENKGLKHYFKITSKVGTWEKIDTKGEELDKAREKFIVDYANYYVNNSIVIYINENGSKNDYSVKLTENSKSTLYTETSMKIQFTKPNDCLDDLKYTCYCHDLSQCNGSEAKNITGLRLFITGKDNTSKTDIELKLYDEKGSEIQYLYYNGYKILSENYNNLYVYFNDGDNVPLLINYGKKWYGPQSKNYYFNKWVFVTGLNGIEARKQKETRSGPKIVSELQKINKALNTISLDSKNNYGLSHTNTHKNFKLDRVNVKKEKVNDSYLQITHKTVKGILGDVTYSGKLVVQDGSKPLNSADGYNQIILYYHISDTDYQIPLLISFTKVSTSIPDLFYERTSKNDNNTFKKIQFSESQPLQEEKGLTTKINYLHYHFNKSIIIQLEKQYHRNYKVVLVSNSGHRDTGSEPNTDSTISVSEETNCVPGSEYTCYKHTIKLGSLTKPVDIGGLKLYISIKEIMIHSVTNETTIPIYYNDSKRDIYVYFYKGLRNKAELVPLIVCYCDKYYGPSSLGLYFDKWKELTSESVQHHIKTHLDSINKELNQINISQTKHGGTYGISKPSQPISDLDSEFYNRVNVKRCKNDYHRMVTHSTINNFTIGNVLYNGKQIQSSGTQNNCNQVCVYYSSIDRYYSKPLLISIGSQDSSCPKKWYHRSSMDGTKWTQNFDGSRYDTTVKIQNEIRNTNSELFKDLNVKINQQKPYDVIINSKGKTHKSSIKIDHLITKLEYKAKDYRCFEHQLWNYYEDHKDEIKNQLSIEDDPTFEMSIQISDITIPLIDKNGLPIDSLPYGIQQAQMKTNLYVYFYEEDSLQIDKTDTVPMMIIYNHRFFGPETKGDYYKQWKEVEINVSDDAIKDKIREKLNDINYNLNEIDPSKKKSYGLPYCPKKGNASTGFSFERIKVSKFRNKNHIMHVHSTVNKCKIGKIKPIGKHTFDDHSVPLKNEDIIEVVLIFGLGDMTHPKLILLNGKGTFRDTTTYGYYNYQNERGIPAKYVFKEIEYGFKLMELINEGNQDYGDPFYKDIEKLKPLLKEICNGPMKTEPSQESVIEDEHCKNPADSESEIDKCQIIGSLEPPVERSSGLPSSQGLPPSLASPSPGFSSKLQPDSPKPGQESGSEHQEDDQELSTQEILREDASDSGTYENDGHTGRESEEESKEGFYQSSEITHRTTDQQRTSENVERLSGNSDTSRFQTTQDNVVQLASENEIQFPPGDEYNVGLGTKKPRQEEIPVTEDGVDNSVNGFRNDDSSNSLSSSSGAQGDENSDKDSGDVGKQILKIVEEHPEAVYGGGGTLATAAAGAYPVYKGIANLMSK